MKRKKNVKYNIGFHKRNHVSTYILGGIAVILAIYLLYLLATKPVPGYDNYYPGKPYYVK